MSQPTPKKYRIERVSDPAGLLPLAQPWAALSEAAADLSLFVTWDWVNAWCQRLQPGWEMWVLTAWDEDGCLVGVAPWTLTRHHYGPLRVDRLAFMGDNYAYRTHQDIVARPEDKREVLAAFLDYLATQRRAWDVLDLEGLSQASAVRPALRQVAWGRYGEKEPEVCPYTELPGTWEAYEMEKLSTNRRQQLRARLRRLERAHPGEVTLGRVQTAEELPAVMDALIGLHQKRWHARGQTSSFDVPSFVAFHRAVAAAALARGWLRLYWLKVGDAIIAAEYCFFYRGVLFDYQKAFDPDWDEFSPGQIIFGYLIRETIAEGGRELDMARGNYDYKFSWTDAERIDYHIALSASLPGHIWLFGGNFVAAARTRARGIVPANVRERINHLLSPQRGAAGKRQSGGTAGAHQPPADRERTA